MPGNNLEAGNITVNKIDICFLTNFTLQGQREEMNEPLR